jgi:SAM-dependent methyltransferase
MPLEDLLVMEVGAATARDSVILSDSGAKVVALDYSHEALKLAREAAGRSGSTLLLVCGDALALPFRDGAFDLVFHQGVLEHFHQPLPLLQENARVTRPGGTVLVDVPQTFHVYTLMKKLLIALNAWFAGWETQFTVGSLGLLLEDSGLETFGSYGRFFAPSLAYRVLREVLMKIHIKLPLRPVIVPPVHRLRASLRKKMESTWVGTRFGCVIGVFARKPEKGS